MNIIEPILFQCKLNPLTTAICTPGSEVESVTYGQLETLINNVARNALKAGLAPGQRVGTLILEGILHATIVFGLMRIGVTTVVLRQSQCPKEITLDAILTDRSDVPTGQAPILRVDGSWLEGNGRTLDYDTIHRTSDEDDCCIMLTTGSTGRPKGVACSHRVMRDRLANQSFTRGPRYAHCARFFCDLGIATAPGLVYALGLLGRGATIYFLGADPAHMLQTMDLHKIQGMATSPYGLGEFVKFFEADPAFEVALDHIICQGAMLSRELSRRARARLCSNLYSGYGSTETAAVAFGAANMTEHIPGAVGYVHPGVQIEILDKDDQVLPTLRDGLVRIQSHYMVKEYVGDPETTKTFFRHGWFHTGDIGHLRDDGMLVITGREKAALTVGGDVISPEVVEEVLRSFPNVRDAAVAAIANDLGVNELHALIVAETMATVQAIRQQCVARLPQHLVPTRFSLVQAIPRGAQGKIERARLEEYAKSAKAD